MAAAVVGATAGCCHAGVLYQTGFENPPFVAGAALAGQDGFVAFGDVNAAAARVLADAPASGSQAVSIDVALMSEEYVSGFYAGFYYRPINYDPIAGGTPVVSVEVDVRLDPGPDSVDPNAGIQVYDASGIYLAGLAIGTGPDGAPGDPVGIFGNNYDGDLVSTLVGSVEFGRYYRLGVRLDYSARTIEYLVDGFSFGTLALSAANELTFGDADLFVSERGQFNTIGRFDNYRITAVPEPSSLVSAALGLKAMAGYAGWKRRGRCRAG